MDYIQKYHIDAKKSLGQNFLQNDHVLDEIASSQKIQEKNIIEVGPGYGALTEKLIGQSPKSLTLVELDSVMCHILEKRISDDWNDSDVAISLRHMDVLDFDQEEYAEYDLIANIPYYITSPILHHFLYGVQCVPKNMTILMQKDVADKILQYFEGKKKKSSVISLMIARKMKVKRLCNVPPECFHPAPKVDSSVLQFELLQELTQDDEIFLKCVKKCFKQPRKTLMNNLLQSGGNRGEIEKIFSKLKIEKNVRPEELRVEDYQSLMREKI